MPLGGSLDPEKSRLRVSADIAGAEVYLGDQDLPIETARGHIVYDLASGLSSDSLTGKLWGLPLRAAISEREPGSRLMAINVLGSAHPQRVAQWLGVDPAGYLSGTSAFRLRIEQQPEGGMRSVLDSDLVGAGSSLPAPLGKSAEAALALHVESLPVGSRQRDPYHARSAFAVGVAARSQRELVRRGDPGRRGAWRRAGSACQRCAGGCGCGRLDSGQSAAAERQSARRHEQRSTACVSTGCSSAPQACCRRPSTGYASIRAGNSRISCSHSRLTCWLASSGCREIMHCHTG